MIKRKQHALVGFFLIYLTFVFMLVSLVVFTPGMKFMEKEGQVKLKNNSVHIIKNVRVELADGTPIDCIPQIMPGSVIDLNVPENKRPTKIIATAPFHARVERTLLPLGKSGFRLNWSINYDTPVKIGKEFELKLRLCAKNAGLNQLLIKEIHGENLFKEKNENRVIPRLKKGDCKKTSFWLTPIATGKTTVKFELEAENFAKKIEKEIKIEE